MVGGGVVVGGGMGGGVFFILGRVSCFPMRSSCGFSPEKAAFAVQYVVLISVPFLAGRGPGAG